jgi:hypothetical protein
MLDHAVDAIGPAWRDNDHGVWLDINRERFSDSESAAPLKRIMNTGQLVRWKRKSPAWANEAFRKPHNCLPAWKATDPADAPEFAKRARHSRSNVLLKLASHIVTIWILPLLTVERIVRRNRGADGDFAPVRQHSGICNIRLQPTPADLIFLGIAGANPRHKIRLRSGRKNWTPGDVFWILGFLAWATLPARTRALSPGEGRSSRTVARLTSHCACLSRGYRLPLPQSPARRARVAAVLSAALKC